MTYFDPGPVVTIEARYGFPAVWVDLTCDLFGLRYNVGRQSGGPQSWLSVVPAGEMVLDLNNESGRYSAFSGTGDLVFGEGTVIRVRCEYEGVHRALFVGQVEEWHEEWTNSVDKVVITCVDPLGVLAEQGGDFDWVPGAKNQTVRARLAQLLNRAGVRGEPFFADQGSINCISPLLNGTSVLNEIHKTATSDLGVFFHEPAIIVDPASTAEHVSQWVYMDRGRFAQVPAGLGALLPTTPTPTSALDWREVTGPADITVGAITRREQGPVPVFSDACAEEGNIYFGYVDIAWAYVAYERPSLVVVTNATPPEERDVNGKAKPLPWKQYSAQVPVNSAHHHIVSLTDLRYTSQAQGQALASAIAVQLGKPKLEVSKLVLWPHMDPGQFAEFLKLRLQDHVLTVRNLRHGDVGQRIIIDSLIEGIEVTLMPRPQWSTGDHRAEWDVRLTLSPVVSDIEDIRPPPDVGTEPGDVYVLAEEGASAGGGVGATGFITISGVTNLRCSYSTTGSAATPVYVELTNIATGTISALTESTIQSQAAIAGGTAVARLFPSPDTFPGNTYRIRLIEVDDPTERSNYTNVTRPLPTPPKPTIVSLAAWQKATYARNAGSATGTSIEWPQVSGVRYQVGIKSGHAAGGTYAAEPVQAGTLWAGSFANDTSWSVAIRYVSGGIESAWSAPLKITMGHPATVIESDFKLLASHTGIDVGPNANFTCSVPYPSPQAHGLGDGQWYIWSHTYMPGYAGQPDGYVGTIISELHIRAEAYTPANPTKPFGAFLCIPSYAVIVAEVRRGNVLDPENNRISTSVPNPSYAKPNNNLGYWRMPFNMTVAAVATNGVVGIRGIGYANITTPIRMRGSVEAWGKTYTSIARLSNKVIP